MMDLKHYYLSGDGRTAMAKREIALISKQGLNMVTVDSKGLALKIKSFDSEDDLDAAFDKFVCELDEYCEGVK